MRKARSMLTPLRLRARGGTVAGIDCRMFSFIGTFLNTGKVVFILHVGGCILISNPLVSGKPGKNYNRIYAYRCITITVNIRNQADYQSKPMKTISIRIPQELHDKLLSYTSMTGNKLSQVVVSAIESYIMLQEKEDIVITNLTKELCSMNDKIRSTVKKYITMGLSKDAAKKAWDDAHK